MQQEQPIGELAQERDHFRKEKVQVAKILSRTLNELKRTKWSQERLMLQIQSLQSKRHEERQVWIAREEELVKALQVMVNALSRGTSDLPSEVLAARQLLIKEDELSEDATCCRCMP